MINCVDYMHLPPVASASCTHTHNIWGQCHQQGPVSTTHTLEVIGALDVHMHYIDSGFPMVELTVVEASDRNQAEMVHVYG